MLLVVLHREHMAEKCHAAAVHKNSLLGDLASSGVIRVTMRCAQESGAGS